ncbi:hypothetical protein MMC15_000255 [Xylographa vitiligo]|nr:hypothetical protein [Xylographa vitiligo]
MPLAQNWRRRGKFEEVAFIFPNAPTIPITVNFHMKMPGWYDITTFDDLQAAHDEVGILRSRDYFNSLVAAEIAKGIPSTRIVVGGFSQGGAISLFTGATSPLQLGGFFGLSAYLLLHHKIRDFLPASPPNKDTPVFMAHGDADPTVRYAWGQQTAAALKALGFAVDFRTYRGLQHSADPEEIDDLETYLLARLPPLGEGGESKA